MQRVGNYIRVTDVKQHYNLQERDYCRWCTKIHAITSKIPLQVYSTVHNFVWYNIPGPTGILYTVYYIYIYKLSRDGTLFEIK